MACDLLRQLHRFIVLCRRLTVQYPLAKEGKDDPSTVDDRDIASAATTIYKLGLIMGECDFDGIDIVTNDLAMIQQCRERVIQEGDRLLQEGIDTHSQTKMAAGLQIFYNLKMMVPKVEALTNGMLDDLNGSIRHVVDMQSLQKKVKGKQVGIKK